MHRSFSAFRFSISAAQSLLPWSLIFSNSYPSIPLQLRHCYSDSQLVIARHCHSSFQSLAVKGIRVAFYLQRAMRGCAPYH